MKLAMPLIPWLLAVTLAACGGATPAGPIASGQAVESTRSPGSDGAGATSSPQAPPSTGSASSDLCGLFTATELASFLGAEPAAGSSGGPLGSTCDWDAGDAFVSIQKVPVDYFEDLRGAKGYRELEKIGDYAFVAAHAFGRIASARTADAAYIVIASEDTNEAEQIEMLTTFIERSPGSPVLDMDQIQ
jgi:hypothetical protein